MDARITIAHGDGGLHTGTLIREVFYRHFENQLLTGYQDAAIFTADQGRLAFTTDTFVVKPLFFRGGDIGTLAVCGTVNDLAAAGALPLYLSAGFVLEEGFEIEKLNRIAASMSRICRKVGAKIIAGDTKVVEKGLVGGVFINTSGIGRVHALFQPRQVLSGDEIILTGTIAEHGTVILADRYPLGLEGDFRSDCSPLSGLITALGDHMEHIKLMRDPTRGGVATALCEMAEGSGMGAVVEEEKLSIRPCVHAVHALLGTDPLYFASEGRMLLVVEKGFGQEIKTILKTLVQCRNTDIIGVFDDSRKKVCLRTHIGGERILTRLENHMISRIC